MDAGTVCDIFLLTVLFVPFFIYITGKNEKRKEIIQDVKKAVHDLMEDIWSYFKGQ